jgi:hypothetical protein
VKSALDRTQWYIQPLADFLHVSALSKDGLIAIRQASEERGVFFRQCAEPGLPTLIGLNSGGSVGWVG